MSKLKDLLINMTLEEAIAYRMEYISIRREDYDNYVEAMKLLSYIYITQEVDPEIEERIKRIIKLEVNP